MNTERYCYQFKDKVPVLDIEETLMLALLAVESMHGRTRVRMDGRFRLDKKERVCVIHAGTRIGEDLAKIFTGFVTREFGDDAVDIVHEPAHRCTGQGNCRTAAAGSAV